jgi:hypothetical protein
MHTHPATGQLLERACASIKYRMRAEILGQSASSKTMVDLQAQILQDAMVQEVLSWQQADGWLGWGFHGTGSCETGIRILCEKGVQRSQTGLAMALRALEMHGERLERGLGKAGKIFDEIGLGGAQIMRATVLAYAEAEDKPCVQAQIVAALAGFKAVLDIDSVEEITEVYRGRLVFKPNVQWPSIYHLRLLAFTQSWRTAVNRTRVIEAVKRLVELSPLPAIYAREKSQLIAPASFCMHDFNPEMGSMDDAHWMMWFHRVECLARLGVVNSMLELQRQADVLASMLDPDGWFTKKLSHPYFTKWGSYTGLMLESNWRNAKRRVYDLTFRTLLILHYAKGGDDYFGI